MLTVDVIKTLVPKSQRSMINEDFLKLIESNSNGDPMIAEAFKENFISYIMVLSDSRYKLTDYVKAVKFVSYKLLGFNDYKAYAGAFPERYQALLDSGKKYDEISPYVSMYKSGKLVRAIFEQAVVPSHVLNAPLFQEALNTLADIMRDTTQKGLMARVKAAEAILAYTKAPEVTKLQLDIGANQLDAISDLRKATANLVIAQKEMLQSGQMSLKDIAESNIIEIEPDTNETN